MGWISASHNEANANDARGHVGGAAGKRGREDEDGTRRADGMGSCANFDGTACAVCVDPGSDPYGVRVELAL